MLPSVCVVVTTYNWPEALDRVLGGLCTQRYPRLEIIVADDGSKEQTAKVVARWQARTKHPLKHCWQPDKGFRAAMIRNKAAAMTQQDYLIFLDGDCVVLPGFVENHLRLAKKNWFVAGNRILLTAAFTEKVLAQNVAIEQWSLGQWLAARWQRYCNRWFPLVHLPLGPLRQIMPYRWQGVKTCNLGLWREDFVRVNGLDEQYVGWGFEDSDLVIRLQRAKIGRLLGKQAVAVIHLWHPCAQTGKENIKRLQQTMQKNTIKAEKGIDQYL